MNPGELGITTPRLITAVTNTSSTGERWMPSDRQTIPAVQAQMPQATTLRPSAIRIVRRPIGEASSSIVSRSSLLARLRCSRRARGRFCA